MMLANNALERSIDHRGRTVLAMDCVLAGEEWASWLAAQRGRYVDDGEAKTNGSRCPDP